MTWRRFSAEKNVDAWAGGNIPIGLWLAKSFLIATSLLAALITSFLLAGYLPERVPTDLKIVGYPAFAGFSVEHNVLLYLFFISFVPLTTLLAYSLFLKIIDLSRLNFSVINARIIGGKSHNRDFGEAASSSLVVTTAFVTSYEASIISNGRWSPVMFCIALVGASLLLLMGIRQRFPDAAQRGRILGIALVIGVEIVLGLLYLVSESTVLQIGNEEIKYPWLPLELILFAMVAVLWVAYSAFRLNKITHSGRSLSIYVTVSVLVFLSTASLPGGVSVDYFHDGERLAGATLLNSGKIPFRDFISIHGIFYDSLAPLIGLNIFEWSLWGYKAGISMIVIPASAVATYIVLVALTRNMSWVLPSAYVFFAVFARQRLGGLPSLVQERFFLLSCAAASLVFVLQHKSKLATYLFSISLFFLVLLTPEALPATPVFIGALVSFEYLQRPKITSLWKEMKTSIRCFTIWSVLSGGWVLFLAYNGALTDYVFYFKTFVSGHAYTGGIPIIWYGFPFTFAVYFTPVVVLLIFGFTTWRWRAKRALREEDWVALALTFFAAYYYLKFLYRSDGHVYSTFTVAFIPAVYFLSRGLGLLDSFSFLATRRIGSKSKILSSGIGAVIFVVALFPFVSTAKEVASVFDTIDNRYQPISSVYINDPLLGSADPGPLTVAGIEDLRLALSSVAGDLSVFDFTNQPALYHFLLEKEPVVRYYHVSMALREHNQLDLIEELIVASPEVIVFGTTTGGLPSWDGIANIVRHLRVSEWILENYKPWIMLRGQTLLQRTDLDLPTDPQSFGTQEAPLNFKNSNHVGACDWGQLPLYLELPQIYSSNSFKSEAVERFVQVSGWVADNRNGVGVSSVAVTVGGRLIGVLSPVGSREDVAAHLGFDSEVPVLFDVYIGLTAEEKLEEIALWGISFDDKAYRLPNELMMGPPPDSLFIDGKRITVVEQLSSGYIELVQMTGAENEGIDLGNGPKFFSRVILPEDRSGLGYVSFDFENPIKSVVIAGWDPVQPTESFWTSPTLATSFTVPVGACPMWYTERGPALYLQLENPNVVQVALGSRDTR